MDVLTLSREKPGLLSASCLPELFHKLRLYRGLTAHQMGRLVQYSDTVIRQNEIAANNPTLKTLVRYVKGLELIMQLTGQGLTLIDARDNSTLLNNWPVDHLT